MEVPYSLLHKICRGLQRAIVSKYIALLNKQIPRNINSSGACVISPHGLPIEPNDAEAIYKNGGPGFWLSKSLWKDNSFFRNIHNLNIKAISNILFKSHDKPVIDDFRNSTLSKKKHISTPPVDATYIDIPTLSSMRQMCPESIVIALTPDLADNGELVSYSFCAYLPNNEYCLEVVITNSGPDYLFFKSSIGVVLEIYNSVCKQLSCYLGERRKNVSANNVTILYNNGKRVFQYFSNKYKAFDPLSFLKSSDKSSFIFLSRNNAFDYIEQKNRHYHYPLKLNFRDVQNITVKDHGSVEELSKYVLMTQSPLLTDKLVDNKFLLMHEPDRYMNYVCNDNLIFLEYARKLFGANRLPPNSLPGCAERIACVELKKQLNCTDDEEFNRVYRGMKKVKASPKYDKNGKRKRMTNEYERVPLSGLIQAVYNLSANAFHGGYVQCLTPGYFTVKTYDYDLRNAYPTAMSCIPDLDYSKITPIFNCDLTSEMFDKPFVPFVGEISFKFPSNIMYPNIPVKSDDGVLLFPLETGEDETTFSTGTDIYTALKLGAEVHCHCGYFVGTRTVNGEEQFSTAMLVRNFVVDRKLADEIYSPKSLESNILKLGVNSIFGKIGQGVNNYSISCVNDDDSSAICDLTNPLLAAMITAGVRGALFCIINQLYEAGYTCFSVTTDGFITDAPSEILNSLDMLGFRNLFRSSRKDVFDDDRSIWEIKHTQDSLLNFKSLGNVSLEPGGVCAHAGYRNEIKKDSEEDRAVLIDAVVNRQTSRVACKTMDEPNIIKVKKERQLYYLSEKTTNINLDFDFKRRPITDSVQNVCTEPGCEEKAIACFNTAPYQNKTEYKHYIEPYKSFSKSHALKTKSDFDLFFDMVEKRELSVETNSQKRGAYLGGDSGHARMMTIVRGYRSGEYEISALDKCKTVQDKLNFINKFTSKSKLFSRNDWCNCGRSERQDNRMPDEMISDLLKKMQSVENI